MVECSCKFRPKSISLEKYECFFLLCCHTNQFCSVHENNSCNSLFNFIPDIFANLKIIIFWHFSDHDGKRQIPDWEPIYLIMPDSNTFIIHFPTHWEPNIFIGDSSSRYEIIFHTSYHVPELKNFKLIKSRTSIRYKFRFILKGLSFIERLKKFGLKLNRGKKRIVNNPQYYCRNCHSLLFEHEMGYQYRPHDALRDRLTMHRYNTILIKILRYYLSLMKRQSKLKQ
ncbi:MAG: hypothetical protein ACTSR3_08065 [Candidatus Helarchaeota archaeon]